MDIAPMLEALVALEKQVAAAAAPDDEVRVYEPWRPVEQPELPAIWNMIEPSDYEIVDTARGDDLIVVRATIGVEPWTTGQMMNQLVRLTDIFRNVVDPALWHRPILPHPDTGQSTASRAKRVVTRTRIDDDFDSPVMCMDMLLAINLPHMIG